MFRYRAHGLNVESDFELPAFVSSPLVVASTVDVTVVSGWPGSSAKDDVVREGEPALEGTSTVLSEASASDRRLTSTRRPDGSVHVDGEGIELLIEPDVSTLWVRTDGTAESDGAVPWFVGGLGLAAIMTLRGALVVHATVLELSGRGHMIMAPSGFGKSLIAAAAVAGGAMLVAEDTVRLRLDADGGCRATAGSTLLRSRRSRVELLSWFDADRLSTSTDGRVLVRFDSPGRDVNVDHIHVLALEPDAANDSLAPLTETSALLSLLAHIRLPGLLPGDLLDHQFDMLGDVVDRVEVDLMRLRWSDGVNDSVADGCDRAGLPDRVVECLNSGRRERSGEEIAADDR